MIWVPFIGFGVIVAALILGAKKSAETVAVMFSLNVLCTAYQAITGDLLSAKAVVLFVVACVTGALILGFRKPRVFEFIIICLIAVNVVIYGSYFFFGEDSYRWLVAGNWVIFAIYCTVAGGAVYEHVIRRLDGGFSHSFGVDSLANHPRRMVRRQKHAEK